MTPAHDPVVMSLPIPPQLSDEDYNLLLEETNDIATYRVYPMAGGRAIRLDFDAYGKWRLFWRLAQVASEAPA